jgi:ankyrin repeat protein
MSEQSSPQPPKIILESPDEYLEQLDNELSEIQTLQKEAKDIYAKKGELCDSEGFYQHSGECWSDALQQVMNNGDTLKEKVQKKYIDRTFKSDDYDFPNNIFKPKHGIESEFEQAARNEEPVPTQKSEYMTRMDKFLFETRKKWVLLYLREAQKRFLRHYIQESKRRNIKEESCKKHEPAFEAKRKIKELSKQLAYRGHGKEARLSAIFGMLKKLGGSRPALEDYVANKLTIAGAGDSDIEILINVYNHVFFDGKLSYNFIRLRPHKRLQKGTLVKEFDNDMSEFEYAMKIIETDEGAAEYFDSISGILFGVLKYKYEGPEGKDLKILAGHEMAFYKCGGKFFFYEDNYGALEYDWRLLFKKYREVIRKKDTQEKTKKEYERMKAEKDTADADPTKKEEFEKLKGAYFKQLEQRYSEVSKEEQIEKVSFNCLSYRRGTYTTGFYPGLSVVSAKTHTIYTVVQTKLHEFMTGTPLEVEMGDDDKITVQLNPLNQYMYDSFFMLFSLGADTSLIKNTGFEMNSDARLQRESILMDIIDKNEDEALKDLEEPYIYYETIQDAFFLAVHMNTKRVLEKLLERNNSLIHMSADGYTPVTLAIEENKPELVKLLLDKGDKADEHTDFKGKKYTYSIYNMVRYKDFTLPYFMFIADIANRSTTYVNLLLESGFNVNEEFRINNWPFKYTLLYLAYKFKNTELMKFLCGKGADSSKLPSVVLTDKSKTLLDIAKEENASQEILNILESCKPATGGRFRKTRKHKIEKSHAKSRKLGTA